MAGTHQTDPAHRGALAGRYRHQSRDAYCAFADRARVFAQRCRAKSLPGRIACLCNRVVLCPEMLGEVSSLGGVAGLRNG